MKTCSKKLFIVWMIVPMIFMMGTSINASSTSGQYTLINQSTNEKKNIEVLNIGGSSFFDIADILKAMQFTIDIDEQNEILTARTSEVKVTCKNGQKAIEVSRLQGSNEVETIYYKSNQMVQVIQGKYWVPRHFFISSRLAGIDSVLKQITGENKWGDKVVVQNVWENRSHEEVVDENSVAEDSGRVIVSVDPRIELLAVIEYLSDYGTKYKGTLVKTDSEYSKAIDLYFGKYKKHEAVKYFSELNKQKFIYDVPVEGMLYTGKSQELNDVRTVSERIKMSVGDREYSEFIKKARTFAEETNFEKFYTEHKAFYQELVEKVSSSKPWDKEVQVYDHYLGMRENSYYIIISPLFSGSYSIELEDTNTGNPMFYYVGPSELTEDDYKKGFEALIEEMIVSRVVKNNLYKTYDYAHKYNAIKAQMEKNKCYTWENCVQQHLIKAVHIRNLELEGRKKEAEELLKREEAAGFIYLNKVCSKLKEYEKAKNKYGSIEAFYPVLLEAFK